MCPRDRPTRNTAAERFVNRDLVFRLHNILPWEAGEVLEELDVVLGPGLVPLGVLGEGDHAAAPLVPGASQEHQLILHLSGEILAARPVKLPGT